MIEAVYDFYNKDLIDPAEEEQDNFEDVGPSVYTEYLNREESDDEEIYDSIEGFNDLATKNRSISRASEDYNGIVINSPKNCRFIFK